jgi:acetylornithine deacetylase
MARDAAIVGESTGLVPMLAHKGVLRLEIEVVGKAAHASDPEAGINAVVAMAPIISELDRLATEVRRRWESHTGDLKYLSAAAAGFGAQPEPLALVADLNFLHPVQVANDIGPLNRLAAGAQTIL